MRVVYDGFILLVAVNKEFFSQRIGEGVMTIGFVGIWLFSILANSKQTKIDRAGFLAQQVRSETGIGAAGASSH